MTEFICKGCGKRTPMTKGTIKYCPKCRAEKNNYKYNKEPTQLEKAKPTSVKTVRRPQNKLFTYGKSLARLNAEARAIGLSYGKYIALAESGGIEGYCINNNIDWRAAFRRLTLTKEGWKKW